MREGSLSRPLSVLGEKKLTEENSKIYQTVAAQIDAKVKLVEENRRYIQEVVIPSYEINDNWDNPHYNNWVKAGGWKDK